MTEIDEIVIKGVTYVPKGQENKLAESVNGMPYVMVRTYSAGVHCGYLASRNGREVKLLKSIRIWYWSGANSLSQLAVDGTSKPDECMFCVEVESIELMEAIEILSVTEKAEKNIKSVKSWKL